MQKTRLGIPVGLLGTGMFLTCFFGGYTPAIILAGYILLFEENAWLKKATVKGIALLFGFAVLSAVVYLIPNAINLIDNILNIFNGNFYVAFVSKLINAFDVAISFIEKILFLILGFKAFNQGTVKIPVIDSLVDKYMG